ncbi:marine proteobacterial sortase target protein [Marinobacterium maritimum]|uniref:Marine proteobacterial sortase target protein n=1 Tax=Marinobacterium maritimum TaxID=500162 RepID=A0ABN1I3F3_9GAMM
MGTLSQIGRTAWVLSWLLLCLQAAGLRADTLQASEVTRGSLVSRDEEGRMSEMPLLDTQVKMTVTGPILRAEVTQTFSNPGSNWTEALYLFPLPNEAAVDHMQLIIGDRVVAGEIKVKEEAKATYEAAKTEGKQAALVEQDRPNLFHTSVANIPPGGEVTVRIEYQQTLVWQEGAFSLRFPLAITPRYSGLIESAAREVTREVNLAQGWQILPGERETRMVNGAEEQDKQGKVAIEVALQPGFPLGYINSSSHDVTRQEEETRQQVVSVLIDEADEYKDFVLSWAPVASAQPSAAFFSEQTEGGDNYGLLMLMPPQDLATKVFDREVTFVIDTSGSMGGTSIKAAQAALIAGIQGLSAGDTFNVIEFNSDTSSLYRAPVAANARNKQQAINFIEHLSAGGGTEMWPALQAALVDSDDNQHLRQVIFITDGSVSYEKELFELINDRLGDARLYTVGIGSAPNSFFMEEAAVAGRGTYRYIASAGEAQEQMQALFDRLAKPVLANISISGAGVHEVMPSRVPDLYAGEPLALAMKLESGAQVEISGRIGDAVWSETVNIQSTNDSHGISVDWAQRAVQDWRRRYLHGESETRIREAIIELGLKYHLVTPYTSMVAVDRTPVRPLSETLDSQAVPTAKPHGLQLQMAQGATGYQWTLMIGMAMLLAAGGLLIAVQRKSEVSA